MLRLILDWYGSNATGAERLRFETGAQWYSEALLPSRFLPKYRGDNRAEGWTHADGVVEHFSVRHDHGDIALAPDARQLTVTEAKMGSLLSPGTKNAPAFDQAARNIACMAQVLALAERRPGSMSRLEFYVIAPASRISEGAFLVQLDKGAIARKVKDRGEAYGHEGDRWFENSFQPTLHRCTIGALAWEELIDEIATCDSMTGDALRSFYGCCLRYNPLVPLTRARTA